MPQGAVDVPDARDPNADGFDSPRGHAEVDDVTDAELVLEDHEHAVEDVLHEVLRTEREPGGHDTGRAEDAEHGDPEPVEDEHERRAHDDDREHAVDDGAERAGPLHDARSMQGRRGELLRLLDVVGLLDPGDDAFDRPAEDDEQNPADNERADDDGDDRERHLPPVEEPADPRPERLPVH